MTDEVISLEMVPPLGGLLAARAELEETQAGLDHEAVLHEAHAASHGHDS